jgi:glycine cleavage system H protein
MPDHLQTTIDKFTFRVATDRLYSPEGVWIQETANGHLRVGVTDFVQQHSGDIAFATVKVTGKKLIAGEEFAALETVKANVSLSLPFDATVVDANPALEATPEVVNQSPYDEGWLAVVQAAGWDADQKELLDAQAYLAVMTAETEREINQP